MPVKIAVALDRMSLEDCERLAKEIGPHPQLHSLKIHSLYYRHGAESIDRLKWSSGGADVWVDAKIHDVPDATQHIVQAMRDAKADIITVHAAGGVDMMRAAIESGAEIYAVILLTSQMSHHSVIKKHALMAAIAQAHGIVCPAHVIRQLVRNEELRHMQYLTPGIRFKRSQKRSHLRTSTPQEAVEAGSQVLVVGEEITKAKDQAEAFHSIVEAANAQ